jgi:hypothetical protein
MTKKPAEPFLWRYVENIEEYIEGGSSGSHKRDYVKPRQAYRTLEEGVHPYIKLTFK